MQAIEMFADDDRRGEPLGDLLDDPLPMGLADVARAGRIDGDAEGRPSPLST